MLRACASKSDWQDDWPSTQGWARWSDDEGCFSSMPLSMFARTVRRKGLILSPKEHQLPNRLIDNIWLTVKPDIAKKLG
jgi:hypothetical protein